VGKTALAVALAAPIGGEILSADAMQVYRGLDIGTAKPSPSELAQVPHHLVDVVSPHEAFDAARFVSSARRVIKELHEKGIPIFVVGGTGLYIKVLTQGIFKTEWGEQNQQIRQRLKAEQERRGVRELHKRLFRIDPEGASKIHPNDAFRIIRALEVYERTGKPMSAHHREHAFSDMPYRLLKFGLYMNREGLYERINRRVEQMVETGLLDEVKGLLAQGYGPELKSMSSIGYRHMVLYLNGELTWEEAVETLKRDTRRYAKRQLTWFRADREVEWVQPTQVHEIETKIHSFLTSCGWGPTVP
jgi:tRNA dimethylallyltransferase